MYRTPYTQYAPALSSRTMPTYSTSTLSHRTPAPGPGVAQGQVGPGQGQSQTGVQGAGQGYLRQQPLFGFAGSLGVGANGLGVRENVNDAAQLDLNDFPALGATPSNAQLPSTTGTSTNQNQREGLSSYASQAQHHPSTQSANNGLVGNGLSRDFTNPDDFPALGGGQSTNPSNAHDTTHSSHLGHGQNGYQGQIGGPISILRNNTFQGDDKRVYGLKQATPTPSSWAQQQQQQQHPPNGIAQQQQLSQTQAQQGQQPAPAGQDNASALDPASTTNANQLVQPHTPADQVLHSAADRWGLLALVRALRQQTDDALSSGQDLGLLGMELDNPGSLYPKFATPWASYLTTTPQAEPNYHLPSCYNVAPPPPNPKKAAQFSDETLFFSFYSTPRDAAQEVAAQELYNRNWRYHKVQRIWITTDPSSDPRQNPSASSNNSSSNPNNLNSLSLGANVDGASVCTVWDVESWERQTRMMRIDVRDLENRDAGLSAGVIGAGVTGVGAGVGAVGDRAQGQGQSAAVQQQQQQGQLGGQQNQVYSQQQQHLRV